MAHYMIQATYTPTSWAAMLKEPQNRVEKVRPAIEKLGGSVVGGWMAFGEYDIVLIVEMPGNANAAAAAIAAAAGGGVSALKTTPLMTPAESVEAMRMAAGSGYQSPR